MGMRRQLCKLILLTLEKSLNKIRTTINIFVLNGAKDIGLPQRKNEGGIVFS